MPEWMVSTPLSYRRNETLTYAESLLAWNKASLLDRRLVAENVTVVLESILEAVPNVPSRTARIKRPANERH